MIKNEVKVKSRKLIKFNDKLSQVKMQIWAAPAERNWHIFQHKFPRQSPKYFNST